MGYVQGKREHWPVCIFKLTVTKPRALVKTSEEISNDNTKNIFFRVYSPCHEIGKTHSKYSDDPTTEWGLPAQKEMVQHRENSMKQTELHPTGMSACPLSALILPMY